MIAAPLLKWYDLNARQLPWRVPPGQGFSDPYRVWLSEIMLQQTTVAAVKSYYQRFTQLWPRLQDLAKASDAQVMAEWAGLGYYARARNLVACARVVHDLGGFPKTREGLARLPGIGPYTSAAIAAIAYGLPETVVDGNVERVISRFFAVETPIPAARPILRELAATQTPLQRPGDYAQAMMDLGATICTPRNPACAICPIMTHCQARIRGIAGELPRKLPRKPKPKRSGIVWIGLTNSAVLLERRAAKGLLGGTLAFPSSGWDGSDLRPPSDADWQNIGHVNHIFTHFELELTVATAPLTQPLERGELVDFADFDPDDLPGLMRKAWALTPSAQKEPSPLPLKNIKGHKTMRRNAT